MDIRACVPGESVQLRRIDADRTQRRRLLELGFVPGRTLRVLGRGATGGLVLAAGDTRMAVDGDTCRSLLVRRYARTAC